MAHWTGFFDSSGAPRLRVSIHGFSKQCSKEFEAIIDTGFSGFVSMPIIDAFPLGLILSGTTTTVLADGSLSPKLMAIGTAVVGPDERVGVILLNLGSGPSDVLVGMEFLKTFQRMLVVHERALVLVDTSSLPSLDAGLSAEGSTSPAAEISTPEPPA